MKLRVVPVLTHVASQVLFSVESMQYWYEVAPVLAPQAGLTVSNSRGGVVRR